jgi:hypothetical protein
MQYKISERDTTID